MQQKKKSSQKKSLREQARIAGFHTRSILWSCITMRPFDYSFEKRKMIETGHRQWLAESDTPIELVPFATFWTGVGMTTITLFPSGIGAVVLALPIVIGTIIYRTLDIGSGRAQKTLERRATKVRRRIENKRRQHLLYAPNQN